MKTRTLLTVEVVTDTDTSTATVGEMEYGVPYPETEDWVNAGGNREKLAEWLEELAHRCRYGETPFRFKDAPSGAVLKRGGSQ